MTKFLISNEPLALFAFFVVRMLTLFYVTENILIFSYLGRHLRHFICGGCLHGARVVFFLSSCCWLPRTLFLLTRQLMHMALSPWVHLLVRNINNKRLFRIRLFPNNDYLHQSCPNRTNYWMTFPPICRTLSLRRWSR